MHYYKKILLFLSLLICTYSYAQYKSVKIIYKTAEYVPTFGEVATSLNLKLPSNIDSIAQIYDPKSISEEPIEQGTLTAWRDTCSIVKRLKMTRDTIESEFDTQTKIGGAILHFPTAKKDSMETIRLYDKYDLLENVYFSYSYDVKFSGNEVKILDYMCRQVMIKETVTSKLDSSKREFFMNAWVTDKIVPPIPIQSILFIYEDILPNFTLLEVTRSPYGPGPHRLKATQVVFENP